VKIEQWHWSLLARQKREGLPRLEGSDSQRVWAAIIREGALSELRLIAENGKLKASEAACDILAEITAKWWIEHRGIRGADLVRDRMQEKDTEFDDMADLLRKGTK
jgi:hypothetical protein